MKVKTAVSILSIACLLAILAAACGVSPPAEDQGSKLSEIEQLYDEAKYKDAMNVARYNLNKDPKDPVTIVVVWKTQVLQGTKSIEYVQEFFKRASEKVPEYGSELVPPLARALKTDANNPVRLFCLLCLGELPDEAAGNEIASVFDPGYTMGDKPSNVTLDYLKSEANRLLEQRGYTKHLNQ
ncbi:MAG: hypothetical protein U9P14_11145 [Gemmatimonadota bacterium]|nr:hypothetical protein [Gemmatimonadota bacterium]